MAGMVRKMVVGALGGEHKLALVVRQDLKMDKGKVAAQCSHATLACYKAALARNPGAVGTWERTGQAKVVLKCQNEEKLIQLERKARSLGITAQSIRDAYVVVARSRAMAPLTFFFVNFPEGGPRWKLDPARCSVLDLLLQAK